jgi:hypothetical protein
MSFSSRVSDLHYYTQSFLSKKGNEGMNWKAFLKAILRNTLITFGAGIAGLGLIGFLIAVKEGLITGATYGVILGCIGLFASAISLLEPLFLGDLAGDVNTKWRKRDGVENKED